MHVKECDLRSVATMVARWRPLAIVLTEDLYTFDAPEFDALARDVSSTLVRVPKERVSNEQIEAMLRGEYESARDVLMPFRYICSVKSALGAATLMDLAVAFEA